MITIRWSKSVALAMVEIAKIQKRDVYVIHFDSSPKNALHTNYFPKDGNYGIEEILDMCEYFARGGTLFEPPLERAQDEIMKQKQFSKADIIFVTDGESAVGDKWVKEYNKWKTENKVNVYTILINVSRGTTVTTDLFSNRTYYLSDFNESKMDNTAFDLFSSI